MYHHAAIDASTDGSDRRPRTPARPPAVPPAVRTRARFRGRGTRIALVPAAAGGRWVRSPGDPGN